MSVLDLFRPDTALVEQRDTALDQLRAEQDLNFHLQESLAQLEQQFTDAGWTRIGAHGVTELSKAALTRAASFCRLFAVANPLIKRGLGLRQAYVWGQGVDIQARATGEDGDQDVNAVVQAFLDDEGNRAAMTGDQAHEELERALGTDGNVFLGCFTDPLTGHVQIRSIPFDEITEVICNPDDRDDPWLYERRWTVQAYDGANGTLQQVTRTEYYPSLRYRPARRPRQLEKDGQRYRINWDAPIYHVSVNRLDGWKFGIGDAYAALPWARAYTEFLEDWATLVKALSRFAWRTVSDKKSKAQQARAKLAKAPATDPRTGEPLDVGATAVMGPGQSLEAIPKTGATIDSESGRPLATMIAAALGVPVTTLLSDPGQTGARAVAETLNLPTRLEMQQRQSVWTEGHRAILSYVIDQAVKAPRGPLRGTITRDRITGRETITLAGGTDRTVDITFPELAEVPVETIVKAIVDADGTQKLPPLLAARLLMQALGVDDVDEHLEDLTDEEGNFRDPYANAGQAAVDAFRRGEDPVGAVT